MNELATEPPEKDGRPNIRFDLSPVSGYNDPYENTSNTFDAFHHDSISCRPGVGRGEFMEGPNP